MPSLNASLPIVIVVMSAPLFLSFQLKRPPDSLYGVPYIVLWTWGVVATVAVPFLVVADLAYCLWTIVRNMNRSRISLTWHALAPIVAAMAYMVFRIARASA